MACLIRKYWYFTSPQLYLVAFFYSQNLRLPAPSRTNRLHNVTAALSAAVALFQSDGVQKVQPRQRRGSLVRPAAGDVNPLSHIAARDIVDGNESKTLELMWNLCAKVATARLDMNRLVWETDRVRRTMGAPERVPSYANVVGDDITLLWKGVPSSVCHGFTVAFTWVKAVAALYGLKVQGISNGLADGRYVES
jgi:hypothetical protein